MHLPWHQFGHQPGHERRGRSAGLLAALATAGLVAGLLAPGVASASAAPNTATGQRAAGVTDPAHRGLYGAQDPTYDGVYRQGMSILALRTSKAPVDPAAVAWLLRQQCGNGRWTSFRSDLTVPCGAGDSNATALAVMALHAVGRDVAAQRGLHWLRDRQQTGGGWEYSAGWGADANSTGLVLQAFLAMGRRAATITNGGASGFRFLHSVQLRCGATTTMRGALDYQPETPLAANKIATAQAAQALARAALPVQPARSWAPVRSPVCTAGRLGVTPRDAAAAYLAGVLRANGGAIPATFGTGNDVGSTANAVLSLVAAGTARAQVRAAMTVLGAQSRSFVLDHGQVKSGAAGLVVLAEHATRGNPRDVGGLNLVRRIRVSITH